MHSDEWTARPFPTSFGVVASWRRRATLVPPDPGLLWYVYMYGDRDRCCNNCRYKNLLVEMPKIIDQFRVLIYSGDFDAQIPHVRTRARRTHARTHAHSILVSLPDLLSAWLCAHARARVVASAQTGTEEWTRGLGYNETSGGGWRPWYVGATGTTSVAGYVTEYDVPTEFTYLTVKAAGHMVPTFKPAESLVMIERFVNGGPY
eukprot:COSAG06_NODE_4543_length_4159_cov_76.449015_3_plen_204_part_00